MPPDQSGAEAWIHPLPKPAIKLTSGESGAFAGLLSTLKASNWVFFGPPSCRQEPIARAKAAHRPAVSNLKGEGRRRGRQPHLPGTVRAQALRGETTSRNRQAHTRGQSTLPLPARVAHGIQKIVERLEAQVHVGSFL